MTNDLSKTHYVEKDNVYITPQGRGNFVFLHDKFVKKGGKKEDGAFIVSMILPPDANLKALDKACVDLAKENGLTVETFLKGEPVATKDKKKIKLKTPFLAADEKVAEVTSKGEEVDLEGWKMIRSSSKRKPTVRDRKGAEIDTDDLETEAYSGRWMRTMVRPYFYDKDGNTGISLGLEGAQLLKHDDQLGGAKKADGDAFGAVEDDEEEV